LVADVIDFQNFTVKSILVRRLLFASGDVYRLLNTRSATPGKKRNVGMTARRGGSSGGFQMNLAPTGLAQGQYGEVAGGEQESSQILGTQAGHIASATRRFSDQNSPLVLAGIDMAEKIFLMAPGDRTELSALEICSLLMNNAHNVDPRYMAFARWFREMQKPYDRERGSSYGHSQREIG